MVISLYPGGNFRQIIQHAGPDVNYIEITFPGVEIRLCYRAAASFPAARDLEPITGKEGIL